MLNVFASCDGIMPQYMLVGVCRGTSKIRGGDLWHGHNPKKGGLRQGHEPKGGGVLGTGNI